MDTCIGGKPRIEFNQVGNSGQDILPNNLSDQKSMLIGLVEGKSEGRPLRSPIIIIEVVAVDECNVLVSPVYSGIQL